jgi:tRNA 2-thiocytidine biosynthesis protein TtcA
MNRAYDAEKILVKLVAKAIWEYGMIRDGDRILIAASGGKDSTSLAYALAERRRYSRERYDMLALHVMNDFSDTPTKARLAELLASWGVPYDQLMVPVVGRLKSGKSMNCYWCSTQRRTELIKYAREGGFNKIALGHHLDDILETLFMNMSQKGELSTMPPVMPYGKYPVTIIRPLALLEERQIEAFVAEKGFAGATCTCPYGLRSKRRQVKEKIEAFTGGSGSVKRNIFRSLRNIRPDYLT